MTASNINFGLKLTKVFIGENSDLMITEKELLNTQYIDPSLFIHYPALPSESLGLQNCSRYLQPTEFPLYFCRECQEGEIFPLAFNVNLP